MKDTTYSISIVLPNYNGKSLLEKNLPSIKNSLIDYEHEIIVVDDCSSDDSVKFLRINYPEVTVIQSQMNQGFSKTCNKGIKAASKEFICISNTDVTFTDNYFKNALKNFTTPDVFAVKGDIINYCDDFENVINIEKTSLLYYKRGFLRFNQKVPPVSSPFEARINSQFVLLGCCFICRNKMLQDLNGYDEIYTPFYWEDADLAMRALKKSYQLIYDENCKVYHQTSATINNHRTNLQRRLVSNRNKFIFTWRHLYGVSNWLSHILYTSFNVATRWAILDWRYYAAVVMALRLITA